MRLGNDCQVGLSAAYSTDDFRRDMKKIGFVIGLLFVFFAFIGLSWPLGWSFVFAIFVGFLIFDAVFPQFLHNRTIPLTGSKLFQPAGYRFASFVIGILIATLISTYVSESLALFVTNGSQPENRLLTVPASLVLCLILLLDFRIRDEPPG